MKTQTRTGRGRRVVTGTSASFMAAAVAGQAMASTAPTMTTIYNHSAANENFSISTSDPAAVSRSQTATGYRSAYICIQALNEGNLYLLTGHKDAEAVTISASLARYLEDIQKRDSSALPAMLAASDATGVDFKLMLVKAMIESNIGLHNAPLHVNGAARGLYQYMPATWLAVFSWYGASYEDGKYQDLAEAIKFKSNGEAYVDDDAVKDRILALRSDHKVAAFIKAKHIKYDEAPTLRRMLNREPNYRDFYVLHLLGQGRAQVFFTNLQRNPGHTARRVLAREARFNRGIFYEGRRALSFQGVYDRIGRLLDNRLDAGIENGNSRAAANSCMPALGVRTGPEFVRLALPAANDDGEPAPKMRIANPPIPKPRPA